MSTGTGSPDYKYLIKLVGVAIVLQVLGWTISPFPFFLFFAYVPLIALTHHIFKNPKFSFPDFFISILAAFLIPAFVRFFVFPPTVRNFLASIGPVLAFILWFYSAKKIGSLRGVYLIIFWLSVEYISILIKPSVFNHLPVAGFRLWGESITWIKFTGFQGTSIWILLTNLLFAHAIFNLNGTPFSKFDRTRFLRSAMVAVLPMIISMFSYDGNPEGDLSSFFKDPSRYQLTFNFNPFYSYYLDYGEYLGKTSFWFSLLILLSLLIRGYLARRGN